MVEYNRNTKITVGTTSVVASTSKEGLNAIRTGIILTNTSTGAQTITVSIDSPAVSGEGIVLYPGGTWLDSKDGGGLPTQRSVNVISDLAGAVLSIQERMEQ